MIARYNMIAFLANSGILALKELKLWFLQYMTAFLRFLADLLNFNADLVLSCFAAQQRRAILARAWPCPALLLFAASDFLQLMSYIAVRCCKL